MFGALGDDVAIGLGLAVAAGGGGTPTPAPTPIPARIAMSNYANRAALLSPNAALTDAASTDNPTGATTALRLTTSGTTTYPIVPATTHAPVDVRNGTVNLPFKPISYFEGLGRFSLELHSAGSPSAPTANYHQMDPFSVSPSAAKAIRTSLDSNAAAGRWQTLGVPISGFAAVGTGADLSAITWARWQVRGPSGNAMVVELGSPSFQPNPLTKGKVIICFDDLYESVFTVARPLFRAKGWNFCFNGGALQANVGQSGRMSLAQMQQLIAEGDQLMFQAWSTESYAPIAAMTGAQRLAEMTAQANFAIANGLGDMPKFGSYFSGVNHQRVDCFDMFRDFLTEGTRMHFLPNGANPPLLYGESFPWPDKHLVRAIAADGAGQSDYRTAHIQQTALNKGVGIFDYHNDIASLPALLDALDTMRGDVDVVTYKAMRGAFV